MNQSLQNNSIEQQFWKKTLFTKINKKNIHVQNKEGGPLYNLPKYHLS